MTRVSRFPERAFKIRFCMRLFSLFIELASLGIFITWARRNCVTTGNWMIYASLIIAIIVDLLDIARLYPRKTNIYKSSRSSNILLGILDLAVVPLMAVSAVAGIYAVLYFRVRPDGKIVIQLDEIDEGPLITSYPRFCMIDNRVVAFVPIFFAAVYAKMHLIFVLMLCCFAPQTKIRPRIEEPEVVECITIHPPKEPHGLRPPVKGPVEPELSPAVAQKLKKNNRWWMFGDAVAAV